MISLKGKVIVVTGGNGLLGKNLVEKLRTLEATVISTDSFFDIQDDYHIKMDITKKESVSSLINFVVKKFKKIDGWVNNAYPRTKDWNQTVEKISFESWKKNIDMHLNGYFLCCQLILKQMNIQKFGSVVNMSSVYGFRAPDFKIYEKTTMTMPAPYSAIKSAIINLTKYYASYYGKNNVRVNCVSPGGIYNNQKKEFIKNYVKKTPLGRMASPSDSSNAVIFLLSDNSSYVTGHNLVVDGGFSL